MKRCEGLGNHMESHLGLSVWIVEFELVASALPGGMVFNVLFGVLPHVFSARGRTHCVLLGNAWESTAKVL